MGQADEAFAAAVDGAIQVYGPQLVAEGMADTEARTMLVHFFLRMAANNACLIAREQGRSPDSEKWRAATVEAFEHAVQDTAG